MENPRKWLDETRRDTRLPDVISDMTCTEGIERCFFEMCKMPVDIFRAAFRLCISELLGGGSEKSKMLSNLYDKIGLQGYLLTLAPAYYANPSRCVEAMRKLILEELCGQPDLDRIFGDDYRARERAIEHFSRGMARLIVPHFRIDITTHTTVCRETNLT